MGVATPAALTPMLIIRQQQRRVGRRQRSVQVLSTSAESNHLINTTLATLQTSPKAVRQKSTTLCGTTVGGVAVVSGVRRMDEVNARRARLVSGWVTVFGQV